MGEITIIEELRADNPVAKGTDLQLYADALQIYVEASKNVQEHGAICAHPRTGTPLENPYLKVMATQGRVLASMRKIKGDRVMRLLTSSP